MSNNRNNNYNNRNGGGYYAEPTGNGIAPDAKKGIAVLVFVLLVAVAYVITSLSMFYRAGAPEWNPLNWGKTKTVEPTKEETVIPQEQGCIVLTTLNTENAPVSLAAARTVSDNTNVAYLTATLKPADADYSEVTWTASHNGIVITPLESDPLSVEITLTGQIFTTETITVEIISVEKITATCNVDYLHFPTGAHASLTDGSLLNFGAGNNITANFDIDTDDMGGTVFGECRITSAEVYLTSKTVALINDYLGYSGESWDYTAGGFADNVFMIESPRAFAGSQLDSFSDEEFRKAFFSACNGKTDCAVLSVGVDLVYRGKTYTTYSAELNVGFNSSTYAVGLNGIEIGDVVVTD